ncbi:serine/threonine protein kinase [Lentzea albida]|uniref:non-specific serine/threonine protein kinase n=2 Tax=Lentzea albida TaxID=65499 RepID=A0A1H9V5L7_9PSEU|nr:serine/threonine protein kinase [Lentzea albida]
MIDPGSSAPATGMFGPYRLESLLGRGGMGEVYRAYDTVKERTVAVKLLPVGLASDTGYQARFRRESQVAARLREPHIIPIHDFGEINGHLFIDMRLVDGLDLGSLLRREGPLDPARAVHVVGQIGAALDAAHAENLIHRDVKPSNVIVAGTGADEFAYLIDFGIVHSSLDTTATSDTALGSPAYTAPERLQPVLAADAFQKAVDIYALGCVLHELLTGQLPFPCENNLAMMFAHLNTAPPRPSAVRPGLPPGLDDVVTRALAKDPRHRHPTAGALAAAARAALAPPRQAVPAPAVNAGARRPDGRAVEPQHTRLLPDQAPRPPARRRALGWGIAAFVLLAVIASAVVLYPHLRSWTSSASSTSTTPVATPSSGPPSSAVQTTTRLLTIPAGGPLFGNDEAQAKGPAICEQVGGKFNVAWFTPGQTVGEYSMVTCSFVFEPTTRRVLDIDAGGLIADEDDARDKAPQICAKAGGTWNERWHDVVPGKYSVVNCTIAF